MTEIIVGEPKAEYIIEVWSPDWQDPHWFQWDRPYPDEDREKAQTRLKRLREQAEAHNSEDEFRLVRVTTQITRMVVDPTWEVRGT